ncbi:MAG: hypothetical protein NZO16_06365 [Deltaproteobacteria bacterium]|nr:hypothetical protein [Deltaproteobacteria bacterium]
MLYHWVIFIIFSNLGVKFSFSTSPYPPRSNYALGYVSILSINFECVLFLNRIPFMRTLQVILLQQP